MSIVKTEGVSSGVLRVRLRLKVLRHLEAMAVLKDTNKNALMNRYIKEGLERDQK